LMAIVRPREPLELKAVYTALELARSLGISRYRLTRLLKVQDVFVYRIGRTVFVPVSEVRDKLQPLWESILECDEKRHKDERSPRLRCSSSRTPLRDP
jgi:hypothetical protein